MDRHSVELPAPVIAWLLLRAFNCIIYIASNGTVDVVDELNLKA